MTVKVVDQTTGGLGDIPKEFTDCSELFEFLYKIIEENGFAIECESIIENGSIVDIIGIVRGYLVYTKNYDDETDTFYLRSVELF